MAEPATQSPYISSSAGGGSSEPGGREVKGAGSPQSCADSFVSSSQPVSLFSTLQAGAQETYLTHSGNQREATEKSEPRKAGKEFIDGQNQDYVYGTNESLGTKAASAGPPGPEEGSDGSRAHTCGPALQAGSPGHSNPKGDVSVNGKADLSGRDQLKELASSVESKFALLTNPQEEPAQPQSKVGYSHSSAMGDAAVEKESPESPFEVIADKLEFDKEFKEVLASSASDIGSNWVLHNEREMLTDIPEDSVCEFRAKPRSGGRIPPVPGLSRQSSGTTAALEEVSKCVREMHSFTNELLNWDLIPKDLDDKAEELVRSGVSASPPQDTSTDLTRLKAGIMEVGKAPTPHHPVTVSLHPKSRLPPEVEGKQLAVSQGAGVGKKVAVATAASVEPKPDISWSNPGLPETVDVDSSSESDDTVIEDAAAEMTFRTEKLPESDKPETETVQAEAGRALHKMAGLHPESRVPSKNAEGTLGAPDHFKAIQAKADVLQGSPPAGSKTGRELGTCRQDFVGKQSSAEGLPLSPRAVSPSLPLDKAKTVVCPEAAKAEGFMDVTKEGLKSEGNDSPEDPVETFSEAELRAARSHVAAPDFQRPPQAAQDFEQEHLTIKALKEAGRKTEMERQPSSAPGRSSLPSGRASGHYFHTIPQEPPVPAQKSALEKRPLCLEEAVDVKLAPGPAAAAFGAHGVSSKSSQGLSPEPPLPHMIKKLLAGFSVHDLIFWRDVKKTGLVFSTTLILLLSLAAFSVISVVSYLILALLSVTISFRVYKSVIQAIQKSEDGHPFKSYLDLDITLSSEAFHNYVSSAMGHVNRALKLIMRLFLVEDLVDSLKLAVVMWLMTYVGAIFNGITLLILGELLVFSVPVVYEKYKTQIDHYVGIARDQIKSIVTKIQAKVPGAVKKKPE
ncbi:reticulon-3 isoform X1 [Pogona vitticeps]